MNEAIFFTLGTTQQTRTVVAETSRTGMNPLISSARVREDGAWRRRLPRPTRPTPAMVTGHKTRISPEKLASRVRTPQNTSTRL